MKTRILIVTGAATLLAAATAVAGTATLTGKLKKAEGTNGKPAAGAKMTVKVKTTDGVVKKVTSAKVKGLGAACYEDTNRERILRNETVDASLGSFTVKRINSGGRVFYRVSQTRRKVGGKSYNFDVAFTSKAGKKGSGLVNVQYMAGANECVGAADFTVKK